MTNKHPDGRRLRLAGKVAIISGGAGGIGAATARQFVEEGAKVVMGDLLDDEGRALEKELAPDAIFVHLDVTDEASWAAAVQTCKEHFGPPTVLLNNAGVMVVGPISEAPIADYERAFEVNTLASVKGIKAVLADMRMSGGGSIVNMSSGAGLIGVATLSAYAASKAATAMVARCVALELGHDGIRVNSVHPGPVDTPMNRGSGFGADRDVAFANRPIPRIGQPDDIAPLLVYLASDESSFCTGQAFTADGGFAAGPGVS